MKHYLIARHFINNENSLNEFKEFTNNTPPILDLLKKYRLNFGLKLTVDKKNLEEKLLGLLKQEIIKIPLNFWLLYDSEDRGPGTSFRQIVFNPTFFPSQNLITCIDLDQFPTEEESLSSLKELLEKVEKEKSLYGIGSRNIPVKLAIHERNSNLRIIHELFHSLTIGSEKLLVKGYNNSVNSAYENIGESTTGVYIVNTSHMFYEMLLEHVNRMNIIANLNGFGTEYYTSIKSSLLGRISTAYTMFKENKFYERKTEEEEFEGVKKLIVRETRELGKTDISNLLLKTLNDTRNTERIAEFYDRSDVELVREWMINGISN